MIAFYVLWLFHVLSHYRYGGFAGLMCECCFGHPLEECSTSGPNVVGSSLDLGDSFLAVFFSSNL